MNGWDIALIALVAAAVGLAARRIIRNKKQGKSACGCDCAHCACNCAAREREQAVGSRE